MVRAKKKTLLVFAVTFYKKELNLSVCEKYFYTIYNNETMNEWCWLDNPNKFLRLDVTIYNLANVNKTSLVVQHKTKER